jgi:hypothetical protein
VEDEEREVLSFCGMVDEVVAVVDVICDE